MTDAETYKLIPWKYRWMFNKLMLAEHLGYICGPAGVAVPEPGEYIVRPVMNLYGMGAGASIQYLGPESKIPPGFFWCEVFQGDHFSVDYEYGHQVFCAKGYKQGLTFLRWAKVRKTIPIPKDLPHLVYPQEVNIEYIGDKVIEVHFRLNPDFCGVEGDILDPIWEGDEIPENFKPDYDDGGGYARPRVGFKIIKA